MFSTAKFALIGLGALWLLSGCGGGGGGSSAPPAAPNASATASAVVAPGGECPAGGVSIASGIDDNGNGVLDSDEVDSTQIVCNGVQTRSPVVVSAISISNTQVLVQFSEPMLPVDAEDPINYDINGEIQGASLPVWDAAFYNPDNSTVLLSTFSQSGISYLLTVSNMRDLDGNPIADPTFLIDPSSTNFDGTDPSGPTVADSDGDGLPDHRELNGWEVTITYGNGTTESWRVNSDPGDPNQAPDAAVNLAAADTDNDGVTDNEERHGGMDPRQPDTDGDTLSDNEEWNVIYSDPTAQDTDGDGTQDGFEFYSYRTSPVLADTDGDQISDTDEVLARNRDPRIADIPRAGIEVGEVRLLIDERYTFEDVQGETVSVESNSSSTLTQSTNRTFATSNENMTQHVAGGSAKFGGGVESETEGGVSLAPFNQSVKLSASFEVESSFQYTNSNTFQTSQESQTGSQQVHEQSLSKAREFNSTSTVTREVFGASIDVDLTIRNDGDLAFSISNLEITVLQADRQSTGRFVPVATLIANSTLITGAPAVFNLGPFTPERGPILFSSRDVFPALVDQLMAAPAGLIFKVANFDMTDEFGRVFSFANQEARDRTAGIIIDFGGAEAQQNLVATALQPNPDGFGGTVGEFVGGFNGDGSPKGIPLDFALQDILGLTRNATVPDGIIAGLDRVAQSIASGDDVQLVPPGTTGVGIGTVVVSAGNNGELDTAAAPGDVAMVTTGYQTSELYCDAASVNAGNLCGNDNDCSGGTCSVAGPEALLRVNGFRNGDLNRQWAVLSNREIPAGAEFGEIILKPGADIYLAFVQDLDEDGLFAREEYLLGSTDSSESRFDNSEFGIEFDPANAALPADDIPDSKDTDRDGLGDFAETRIGWRVSVDAGRQRQVFSSPRLRDSDGDGLLDPEEQDLRTFCDLASRVAAGVGFGDPGTEDLFPWCHDLLRLPVQVDDALAIIAGLNGTAESTPQGDDRQLIAAGITGLTFASVVIDAGPDGNMQSNPTGDDRYVSTAALTRIPPATDPGVADTDADGISDGEELKGFSTLPRINAAEVCFSNAVPVIAETQAVGDDIQHTPVGVLKAAGVNCPSQLTGDRLIVILPGPNGIIDSIPAGNDVLIEAGFAATDPLNADTDGDQLSDGRERALGSDPNISNFLDFRDSDQDGLSDAAEQLGWLVSVNGGAAVRIPSNPSLMDSDLDGLPDLIERDLGSHPVNADTDGDGLRDFDEFAAFEQYFGVEQQFPGFSVNGSASRQHGTDPTLADSDLDGRSDDEELLTGYRILLAGEPAFRQIFTNPLEADTDLDGVSDHDEWERTDATDPDTDDDGAKDGIEARDGTDPLVPDILVTVSYEQLQLTGGPIPFRAQWELNVSTGGNFPGISVGTEESWAADFAPGPLPAGTAQFACGNRSYIQMGNLGTLVKLGTTTFPLRAGQGFSLNGGVREMLECPSVVSCNLRFFESFSFEGLQAGAESRTSKTVLEQVLAGCGADIFYSISIARPRELTFLE